MKILKFEATWCGPCKQMDKVIETIDFDVEIDKIDIDDNREALEKYSVRSVPTLIRVDDEGVELDRLIGSQGAEDIKAFVNGN
ncbi:thioredoxin family protein [bacterium]|nr:thioredoxin family protein [bacterium]